MKNIGKIIIIAAVALLVVICIIAFKTDNVTQNPVSNNKSSKLPKDISINDVQIVYLCKTTYNEDGEEEYKKKDLYNSEAMALLNGIAQITDDNDCISLRDKINEEELKYKYLVQGYNEENYIEFRIEIFVYNESANKKTVVEYDKLKDYYNPEEYILDNPEAAEYIIKYMDNMSSDKD